MQVFWELRPCFPATFQSSSPLCTSGQQQVANALSQSLGELGTWPGFKSQEKTPNFYWGFQVTIEVTIKLQYVEHVWSVCATCAAYQRLGSIVAVAIIISYDSVNNLYRLLNSCWYLSMSRFFLLASGIRSEQQCHECHAGRYVRVADVPGRYIWLCGFHWFTLLHRRTLTTPMYNKYMNVINILWVAFAVNIETQARMHLGLGPWDSEHLTRLRWNFLDWNFKVLQKYLKELCFQMLRVLPVRLGLHLFKVLTPDALWSTMITDDRLRSPIAYLKHLEVKPRGFLELLRLKGLVSTPSMTIWLFDYLSIELTKWYPISPHFMIIVIFMWYSCDICWFLAWCLPSPQSHQLDGGISLPFQSCHRISP